MPHFSLEEDEKLVAMWRRGTRVKDIASALKRCESSVCARAYRLGFTRRRGGPTPRPKWTEENLALLDKLWRGGMMTKVIARAVGCHTPDAVERMAYERGLPPRVVARTYTKKINLQIPAYAYNKIQAAAAKAGMPMTRWINSLIKRELGDEPFQLSSGKDVRGESDRRGKKTETRSFEAIREYLSS